MSSAADTEIRTRVNRDETRIEVTGSRDVAIVVRSPGGERIYLPPEDRELPSESQRSSTYTSPYQSSYARGEASEDSPYREAATTTRGVITTPTGFRIHHGEPITEIAVYRDLSD